MYASTLVRRIDRIIETTRGLSPDQINVSPPIPEANSLAVLAVHTMANADENVLAVLGGETIERNREREFRSRVTSGEALADDWSRLRTRIETFLNELPDEALNAEVEHPRRGRITGRKVLLAATVHAAEHVGHAELTRDWIASQG
jgi:hypothetical protein